MKSLAIKTRRYPPLRVEIDTLFGTAAYDEKQHYLDFITRFVAIINSPQSVSPALRNYLLTEGGRWAMDGIGLGARHLLYWLDRQLKTKLRDEHELYVDRLSEAGAGWGEADPVNLTEADPLGLVTTLEGLGCKVVIVDADATDDASAGSTSGCVRIHRNSTLGANSGDITTIGGTNKTTTGLFNGSDYRYKFWKTLTDLNERNGGGLRFPNSTTVESIVLVRAAADGDIVNRENQIGVRIETQTVAISGTPGSGDYRLISSDFGTTAAIAYNATAADVQAALRLLPDLSEVTVTSSGTTPNFTHTIAFHGVRTVANPAQLTSSNSFNQGSIGHATTQTGGGQNVRITLTGYPGEFPDVYCGNSTDGDDDVTPGTTPDATPADTATNGTSTTFRIGQAATNYRNNFHLRNIRWHGKRETAGGAFIFTERIVQLSFGAGLTIRHCEFVDCQCIVPGDANAAGFPALVDLANPVRATTEFFPIYLGATGCVFDSNRVEPVAIGSWPDNTPTVTRGDIEGTAIDVKANNVRITRNTFRGVKANSMIRIGDSDSTTDGVYVADNDMTIYDKKCIDIFNSTNFLIERNRLHDFNIAAYQLESGGMGISVQYSANGIIQDNVIYNHETAHSGAVGILVGNASDTPVGHAGMSNVTVRRNLLYRCGILVDANFAASAKPVSGLVIESNIIAGMTEARKGAAHTNAPINIDLTRSIGTLEGNIIRNNQIWRFANGTPDQTDIEPGPHLTIKTTASQLTYSVTDTLTGFTGNVATKPTWLGTPETPSDDHRVSGSLVLSGSPFTAELSKAWEP